LNLLRAPKALNLHDFSKHFDFTRRVTTNKAKITCKAMKEPLATKSSTLNVLTTAQLIILG